MNRRRFVRLIGEASAAAPAFPHQAAGESSEDAGFAQLLPPDKNLLPKWLRTLTQRHRARRQLES